MRSRGNIIISGFASIGKLDLARRFFDEAPRRDLISWNSLLARYARRGDFGMVMKLFRDMLVNNVRPDKVIAISLVSAAEIGELNQGRCGHGWVLKAYGNLDAFLWSASIDMYSWCGNIWRSFMVFENVSKKDVTLWMAMITGLAFHGFGAEARERFHEMQEESLMPNSVTLVAVLTACNHAGLVDKALRIFESMKQRCNIELGVEQYGFVVDLLAWSGRLSEALNVKARMPMKPSRSIWGAILSSSKAYGDLELAGSALT
ncbi:hypothetical protein C4D60_Mb01t32400 [Musa balbisiana]|uniref:Pentatricopeptide repeat-containing protein n=1 Tax=Musa balbisiana TaxID=52838 RepID=A0A4S8JSC0_MUSBA|nr:hypothetical protein C4D60_Mb01t32400 [Musa balbisiana]